MAEKCWDSVSTFEGYWQITTLEHQGLSDWLRRNSWPLCDTYDDVHRLIEAMRISQAAQRHPKGSSCQRRMGSFPHGDCQSSRLTAVPFAAD